MVDGPARHRAAGWLQFALADPGSVLGRRRFYRGAWNALRGGAANMDVLVALGTTAAFVYSVAVGSCRSPASTSISKPAPW